MKAKWIKVYCKKCGKFLGEVSARFYDPEEDLFCADCYAGTDSLDDSDEILD